MLKSNKEKKICLLQTDNRLELDYLLLTSKLNQRYCDLLIYNYHFINLNELVIDDDRLEEISPATKKVFVVNNFLYQFECDILIFLDSDAWIHNGYWLDDMISILFNNPEKHGCFSREPPYSPMHTFINSGSFVIKNNEYIRNMYKKLIYELKQECNSYYLNAWPFDQHFISNYVFENKNDFYIYTFDVLNTPTGFIFRHNWEKNEKMFYELNLLLNADLSKLIKTPIDLEKYIDTDLYPLEVCDISKYR